MNGEDRDMKPFSLSKVLVMVGTLMLLGLGGCGEKKKSRSVAITPGPCVGTSCPPIVPGGSGLFSAAGYWGSDPNYFMVLNIATHGGGTPPPAPGGQYAGSYVGPIAVTGYIRSINPTNYPCDLPGGDIDVVTQQPGQLNYWNIFSGIQVQLVHRGTGANIPGFIQSGFFTMISPWAPPGTSSAYNFGLYVNLQFNSACGPYNKVFGTP
jgi:hypothetical protein